MKSGFIQNGYFLLFTFVTGLFYFCFYMVALSFSLSLAFTVIGIPLVTRVLRTTTTFIQFERRQTKLYTDITTAPYESKVPTGASVWAQSKLELTDRRNWRAVFWLMRKFLIGLVSLVCAVVIYVVPLVCLLAPLLYRYIKMNFIFMEVDTFIDSLLIMGVGVVLAAISLRLVDGLVQKIGGYTRSMIRALNR
ncbi:sensor domain-containing protein [Paenibacillus tianjinensis]|uniref:Sensor domain-containing protein n=1 Tax=Paenibacillus tianjinensis TaxID=2810347 RepID=A0ABX7LF44_9BACL|nr:sensor domain-containing protein [Paenibacillus tianjinensis]QSF44567.1 sensor domain-containing protein [Paenibacillus tianjinensis]